jgi:GT2 family glycosyltransferase
MPSRPNLLYVSGRISTVVVNYEQRHLLRQCLASLVAAHDHAGEPYEIVVVDNGSSDGSVDMIAIEFPDVRVVALEKNAGFAGGVSIGIRESSGEWIFCVNNDAAVELDAVKELLRVAHDAAEDVGSVAALMVFADRPRIINSAGIDVDRLGIGWDRLMGSQREQCPASVVEVFGACAGAALYRRAMLQDVPFDASFFVYREDVDVAWRARMRGWRCLLAPTAIVFHSFSSTARHRSDFKHYWSGRNRVRLLARNATWGQLLRSGATMVAFDLAVILYVLMAERSLAPIRGRVAGFRTWRADRCRGARDRRSVRLAPFAGFRAAMRRRRSETRLLEPKTPARTSHR